MALSRVFGSLVCLAIAGACISCGDFDQRWNSTATPMTANPAALMAGKWEGNWESDASDYEGQLQAIIEPTTVTVDDNKTVQQYKAQMLFMWKWIPFDNYTVTLNAVKGNDKRLHFVGRKDIGVLKGGVIHFDGYVDPVKDVLYLDYSSDRDTGTYLMHRIIGENQ